MTVFFGELMKSKDIRAAADELASEFRAEHKLPKLSQLGLVVPELRPAARELGEQGIGPFFITPEKPVMWRERGENLKVVVPLALAEHHGVEVELIEPARGSMFYNEALDPRGRIAIHHLGFIVSDVDRWAADLEAAGCPVWVRGRISKGPAHVDYAYMDTVKQCGLVVEFISWSLFGRAIPPPKPIINVLGRIQRLVSPIK